jgi:hypothetical protein
MTIEAPLSSRRNACNLWSKTAAHAANRSLQNVIHIGLAFDSMPIFQPSIQTDGAQVPFIERMLLIDLT